MRAPSIQKTTAASLLLHLLLLALSVVLISNTKNIVLPSPYTVSLVSPGEAGRSGRPSPGPRAPEIRTTESKASEKEAPVKESRMIDAARNTDDKRLKERLAELAAKENIKRIVKMRQVISVKSSGGQQASAKTPQKNGSPGGAKGTLFDSYYGKITDEIWAEWNYPDYMKKNLEAIVSVVIEKDGTLTGVKMEKSSGDRFFDNSALKAVTKASPVSPPPYEMEIGVRFYP